MKNNTPQSTSRPTSQRKVVLIASGVFLVTLAGIVFFLVNTFKTKTANENQTAQKTNTKTPNAQQEQASSNSGSAQKVLLNFSKKFIDASKNGDESYNVDVLLDTNTAKTSGAIIEIVYDPDSISNVDLLPAFDTDSLYGETSDVTTLSHSPEEGKFVLGISTSSDQNLVEGKGRIATLSFKPLKSSSKDTTSISFSSYSEGLNGAATYPADPGKLEVKIK